MVAHSVSFILIGSARNVIRAITDVKAAYGFWKNNSLPLSGGILHSPEQPVCEELQVTSLGLLFPAGAIFDG